MTRGETNILRPNSNARSLDISFEVPFTHRLRVTDEVSGADFAQLMDVLQPGESGPPRVLLVAEKQVADASPRVREIENKLKAAAEIQLVAETEIVDGGEDCKNSDAVVQQILRQINANDLDRRSYVIVIGGGAVLDAVGYAAAIAHRGIRLVRLPTTTLAQADSGVGVKNAINQFGKKNWVGTFAVPWAVINDSGLLESLPDRDFSSGFSEAVKVSLLKDADQFNWLCDNAASIRARKKDVCNQAIHNSCVLHLRHITEGGDPFEMLEARPLDFGHWSAHKLEPITGYQIRHGEAVAIGVAIDCLYSSMKFGFPRKEAERVCRCLQMLGIPLWHDELHPVDRLLQGLEEFRQHLGGRLTITMLKDVGHLINVHQIDTDAMKEAIGQLQSFVNAGFSQS